MSEVVVPGTTSPYFQINSIENSAHSMHEGLSHMVDVLKSTFIKVTGIVLENLERANTYIYNYLSNIHLPRISSFRRESGFSKIEFALALAAIVAAVLAGLAFNSLPAKPGSQPDRYTAPPPGQPIEVVSTLAPIEILTQPTEVLVLPPTEVPPPPTTALQIEAGSEITIKVTDRTTLEVFEANGTNRIGYFTFNIETDLSGLLTFVGGLGFLDSTKEGLGPLGEIDRPDLLTNYNGPIKILVYTYDTFVPPLEPRQ